MPITIIDTGIDLTHPEFAGRPNTIAARPAEPCAESSEDFHGTAVASVVAAPENGVGIVGVYPQAVLRLDRRPAGLTVATSSAGSTRRSQPARA